jgi:hypothetical protein
MSTRCNIIINFGNTTLTLYRHMDGYLSGTGKDLYNKLFYSAFEKHDYKNYNIAKFIKKLLDDDYSYRLDDKCATDIQYLYIFNFKSNYKHANHYNKVELSLITVDENHQYGRGAVNHYANLSEFHQLIEEGPD